MGTIKVRCVFVKPLLMDPMTDDTLEELRTGNRAQKDKQRPKVDVCKEKLYRQDVDQKGNPTGPIGLPQEMLFSSHKFGGRNVKNGKKLISTLKTTTMPDFMSIEELFVPLELGKQLKETGKTIEDIWTVDSRRGRLKDGTAICVIRPKFPPGIEFEYTIEYDEGKVNETTIRALVTNAGSAQGLGSFRPNCGGPFGRFRIMTEAEDGINGWVVTKEKEKVKKAAA